MGYHTIRAKLQDEDDIQALVRQILTDNPNLVADYCSGKDAALRAILGPLMLATSGNIEPELAHRVMLKELTRLCQQNNAD